MSPDKKYFHMFVAAQSILHAGILRTPGGKAKLGDVYRVRHVVDSNHPNDKWQRRQGNTR